MPLVTVETSSSVRRRAVAGEDRLAASQDHRLDHEPKLVDQPLADERSRERGAPHHHQVAALGLAQLPDAGDGLIAGDAGRVVPRQLVVAQRRRHDVLGDRVHPVGERVAGALGPRRGHRLPRAPPEEQRVGVAQRVVEAAADGIVEERVRPAPVREAAVGVLVGPARCLYDAVQADELGDHDAHGLLLGRTLRRCRRSRRSGIIAHAGAVRQDGGHGPRGETGADRARTRRGG